VCRFDLKSLVADPVHAFTAIDAKDRAAAAWALLPYLAEIQRADPLDLSALSRVVDGFDEPQGSRLQKLGIGMEVLAASLAICLSSRWDELRSRFGEKGAEQYALKHFNSKSASAAERIVSKAISTRSTAGFGMT
jgi:hypothetical protein